ncbi:hypothetical protein [Rhodoflexus sp.]
MNFFKTLLAAAALLLLSRDVQAQDQNKDSLRYPQEKHLRNIRQFTFGGDNAEAYFSFDGQKMVFQSNYKMWGLECDQVFYFDLREGNMAQHRPQIAHK